MTASLLSQFQPLHQAGLVTEELLLRTVECLRLDFD